MDLDKTANVSVYFKKLKISNSKKKSFLLWTFVLLVLIVLKITFLRYEFDLPTTEAFLNLFLGIFFVNFLIDVIVLLWASSYRRKHRLPSQHYDNFTVGITLASYIVKAVIYVSLFLYAFDVDVEVFFTSLALFSVALAWLTKEYVDNLIDGLIILFSKDFKIKDYIKVEDYKGRINYITLQNIQLLTDEGDYVYIPNTVMLEKPVVNYSKVKNKTIDYKFEIPNDKLLKLEKFEKFIKEKIQEEFVDMLDNERIRFKIEEVTYKRVKITLSVPVLKYNFDIEDRIKKFLSLKVIRYINGELKV